MASPKIERQGLLQPEEFDIDDVESIEPQNGHVRHQSHDWSKGRSGRSSLPSRWLRPRYIICGLVTVAALLMVGIALNKGAGIKIPKLIKPSPPQAPDTSKSSEPVSPQDPNEPKPPSQPQYPDLEEEIFPTPSQNLQYESTASASASPPSSSLATDSTSPSGTSSASTAGTGSTAKGSSEWKKPSDFKIIGLIFFGRPPVVAVLDCYLKRNLASNGGWLDEVHFVVNTQKEEDIMYLDKLVATTDAYKKKNLDNLGYNEIWKTVEPEHMYIKIDDDIVYFHDDAISNIVYTKIHHNNSLNVVATLVNSPETGWLHYRLGAIHSYLPELHPPKDPSPESLGPTAWRASKLPLRDEVSFEWEVTGVRNGKPDDGSTLPPENPGAPPFKGHRWLPLPENERNLDRTPMVQSSYDPNGPDWGSWSLGAQAHYSFLENLEKDQLDLYHYGYGIDHEREGIWNMMYDRMNINFMAIWGKDVLDNLPFETPDDEAALSQQVTRKLRRPLLINTHAIAAHFSFRSQLELYDTDLLSRYRAYANEFICTKDNQIPIPPIRHDAA